MNKKEINEKRKIEEAKRAVYILEHKIHEIRYVKDWALIFGCSKTKLNNLITIQFCVSPKVMMKQVRFERIKDTIKKDPSLCSFAVADQCGLLNEKTLYQFLSRNFETSFSNLRFKLLWDWDDSV
ncbi:MAG: AraC family transcriptional regulator [Balneolaceae bacterium]|nr:AraC family transcriptional regulator [Balneolaceae bacterium]